MTSSKDWKDLSVEAETSNERELLLLSAIIDHEVDATELGADLTIYSERWSQYHVISDALHEQSSLEPVSLEFVTAMSAALHREAAHGLVSDATRVGKGRVSVWGRLTNAWPGIAVAAAVMSIVWVAEPLIGLTATQQPVAQAEQSLIQAPPGSDGLSQSATLDYVNAHRQLAGPIAVRDVSYDAGAR